MERRLRQDNQNRQRIKEKLYYLEAGYGGECQYDKYITEFKPRYPHAILHDVTLIHDGIYFQMDSLLITPSFIIISEVKNIAEKIIVKSNPLQFIKEYTSGQRMPLRNPITEVERKNYLLENWLLEKNIKIPVEGLVAFAYNNEMQIEEKPNMEIMFTYDVPAHLRSLAVNPEILSGHDIRSLAYEIYKSHMEFNPFPMTKRFDIHPAEIIPGVICSECGKFNMKWESRKWKCHSCGQDGKDEYKAAIEDWFMLIKNTMTNREFRYFTQLECRHVAKHLLGKAQTKLIGHGRNAHYEFLMERNRQPK
ncbi:nuclease-related domain-containing protein [Saccharococcus sp. Marseille-Q5394]|uniref:nuclease-related domain-containing protein n=1 Tax=Saccharococcus sp. Marseille-Q5394 TaxID=2972778 RepID=UPI0021C80323|nr:nuclease-related domain-containing protein [Saccharococcus sp. Marseille-Q5394]